MPNEDKISREQMELLGLLDEGHVLRQRPQGLMLTGQGWVIAPPGGDEAVRGLSELGYVEGGTLTDAGREVWEDWCKANPHLVPKRPR